MRSFYRLLVAAAVLFALAGCMTVDGQLEVGTDDTVTGEFVVAVERAALVDAGVSEEEFLLRLGDWNPLQRLPAGGVAAVEPYVADHLIGKRYRYDHVPLETFGQGGSWRIQHVGNVYRVVGEVDFSGMAAEQSARATVEANRGWDVILQITFPGRVESANGQISGRTVTWKPEFAERAKLAAEAADGSSRFGLSRFKVDTGVGAGGAAKWVVGSGVVGEFLAMSVTVLLWRRRRRAALAATPDYSWRAQPRVGSRGRHRAR